MLHFLKSKALGFLVLAGLAVAGPVAHAAPDAILGMEAGKEYRGLNYLELEMATGSPEDCRQICLENSARCKAYTYYKAGVKSENPVCHIKDELRPATVNATAVGGTFQSVSVSSDLLAPPRLRFENTLQSRRYMLNVRCPGSNRAFTLNGASSDWEQSYSSISGNQAYQSAIVEQKGFQLGKHLRCYYDGEAYAYMEIPEDYPECQAVAGGFACYPPGGPVEYKDTVELVLTDSAGINFSELGLNRAGNVIRTDLWYGLSDGKAVILPHDIRISNITASDIGPDAAACAARLGEYSPSEISVDKLPVGSWVCFYMPPFKIMGRFRVDERIGNSAQPQKLKITYFTWQKEVAEPFMPIPEPLPIAAQTIRQTPGLSGVILGQQQQTTETFVKPMHEGYRVDWCLNYGSNCGADAARKFCQLKGFSSAASYPIARDIGRTKTVGDKRVCDDPGCDGFAEISCR